MQNLVKIKRALISVSDKAGLEDLVTVLTEHNIEIISSGGTRKYLENLNFKVTPIEQVTGNPEAFSGRMKTLSFQVSSALLYRRDNEQDLVEAKELSIEAIDLVVCNLYPFEKVAKEQADWDVLIENIDIGGPTMVRAAAKNYKDVCVATNKIQYANIISELKEHNGETSIALRQKMALAAFKHLASYDSAIVHQMEKHWDSEVTIPVLSMEKAKELRYGENPHQKSWLCPDPFESGIANAEPIQGKALSYNNLLDADAAWRCNGDLSSVAPDNLSAVVTIIKHSNPCGAACSATVLEALELAWAGDPISSFGSIICFNQEVTTECATWLKDKFIEVIIAPSFSADALEVFAKKKNLRLLPLATHNGEYSSPMVRSISGGWLVQQEDSKADEQLQSVTKNNFPESKHELASFGVMACKHLRSNAIGVFHEFDNGLALIGAGMGNPNRLISLEQAVNKARENGFDDLSNDVLISDAFFPFSDNIDIVHQAGIKYVLQPGGSIQDNQVIEACNDVEMSMAFTGRRHFRH